MRKLGIYFIYWLLAVYILLEMGCVGSKKSEEPLPKAKYVEKGEIREEVSFSPSQPFELVVNKVE